MTSFSLMWTKNKVEGGRGRGRHPQKSSVLDFEIYGKYEFEINFPSLGCTIILEDTFVRKCKGHSRQDSSHFKVHVHRLGGLFRSEPDPGVWGPEFCPSDKLPVTSAAGWRATLEQQAPSAVVLKLTHISDHLGSSTDCKAAPTEVLTDLSQLPRGFHDAEKLGA